MIGGGQPTTSCFPGGAGNLLSDLGGGGGLRQRIDVRGNAPQFQSGSLALRVDAFLGGVLEQGDEARVDVRFLDASLTTIAPLPPVGPVSSFARNEETVLLKREREYFVPASTAYVEVEARFTNVCCGSAVGLLDNVSARFVAPSGAPPVALNTNLVSNGSFDQGSLPGSPLELTNPGGWFGTTGQRVEVAAYGSSADYPGTALATQHGLGGSLLGDLDGGAVLRQEFDVSAGATAIDVNRWRLFAAAWLGGTSSITDRAEVRIQFLSVAGVQLGVLHSLGPVTAAERTNQTTLLERSGDFAVPALTRRVAVEVRFTNDCCGGAFGLADDVRVVVYDTLFGGPSKHPGTGEDLRLFSGVNAAPTTGPGEDVVTAAAFDVVNLRIDSPNGTFDFAPLVLAANAYATGGTPPMPPPGLPGLVLDPFQLLVLLNGFGCSGFGCASVLPGGTVINFPVPPGLTGTTVLIQAFALPQPGLGTPPANGVFAASDAHELVL